MEKKYMVLICLFVVLTIITTILLLPYFSSNTTLKKQNTSLDKPNVLIVADSTTGTAPLSINFKSILQNFNGKLEYRWDFGDGASSEESHPVHSYDSEGTYNCSLTVVSESSSYSDHVEIEVYENNPPFVKIIVDKTTGFRPMTVNFDIDGFDTDGEIVSYDWEIIFPPVFSFQKVIKNNEKNFSERFLIPGFYEVKLTVTDDTGNIATDYLKIQVQNHQIELIIKTGFFYIGTLNSVIQVFKNIKNFFDADEPETFFEKIKSFYGGK